MESEGSGGPPRDEIRQVRTEKVVNVWGSVAGAGSDFFHLYRNHRNTEMNRLKEMDEEEDERLANEELQHTRERRAAIEANKTAKRAAKRKRKSTAKATVQSAKDMNRFKNDGSYCTATSPNTRIYKQRSTPTKPATDPQQQQTSSSSLPCAVPPSADVSLDVTVLADTTATAKYTADT
eukprot:Lankesteria_metandrocarpae@DN1402_c0_g1_i1.p1